jgi:abhydrolase domain-containing protein 17
VIRLREILVRLLYIPVIPYFGAAISGLFFSDQFIFLPHRSSYRDSGEILKLRSTNGNRISALYLVNPSAQYTLLVSHGNAEDLGDDREWLSGLQRAGFNVFAYDYQGYGTSEGRPSERAAYDDESSAYDYLTRQLKIPAAKIIIFGRSVGTGPAVHIAARRPAAALILQSPFLSAFRVITRYPLLPFDKFPNSKDIRRVHCPLLVIHGTQDQVIGQWHGQRLFVLANEPKQFVAIPGAGHNDLQDVAGTRYPEILQEFARSIAR